MTTEVNRDALPSILLVDDDAILRERLAQAIRARGYDVRTAGNAEEAMREADRDSPEMAVVDLKMPGGSGIDVLRALKKQDAATRVLMLTGYGSIATAVEAVREGAIGYLPKPADADEILSALNGTQSAKQQPGVETPVPGSRRVGAHPARALRLRREHLRGGAPARHPPPLAPAQAAQVPAVALSRAAPRSPGPYGGGAAQVPCAVPNPFPISGVEEGAGRREPNGRRAPRG